MGRAGKKEKTEKTANILSCSVPKCCLFPFC